MARDTIIAGNWKMNQNPQEVESFFKEIKPFLQNINKTKKKIEVIIFSPDIYLKNLLEKQELDVIKQVEGKNIRIGAQNTHYEDNGAYTGETSVSMYKDIGVRNILVGHSERREYFNETNEITNKKVLKIIENDLNAMLCVGEKDGEDAKAVLKEQIKQGLSNISEEQLSNLKIAYEPVWAIGTGKTAEPEQAQERHEFIRELLSKQYNTNIAQKIPILYGGSVNEENAGNLLSQNDIDGALVGGASLRAEKFGQIITQAL